MDTVTNFHEHNGQPNVLEYRKSDKEFRKKTV